jgi:hypothetical protein
LTLSIIQNLFDLYNQKKILWEGLFIFNELTRRKRRGIQPEGIENESRNGMG